MLIASGVLLGVVVGAMVFPSSHTTTTEYTRSGEVVGVETLTGCPIPLLLPGDQDVVISSGASQSSQTSVDCAGVTRSRAGVAAVAAALGLALLVAGMRRDRSGDDRAEPPVTARPTATHEEQTS